MIDLIQKAVAAGAKIYSNVSGGKDGQAMTKALIDNGLKVERLIHADLGRVEWKESLGMCERLSELHNIPLSIVVRSDGQDLLSRWQSRMKKLEGSGKPFWSSSKNRYCTSDMKRDPITVFYTSTGNDFIISCEGIRSQESVARSKKEPLTFRRGTSSYYKGMTPEEAIGNFKPGKKLILTYYPIFNFTVADVWSTYGNTVDQLEQYRQEYIQDKTVNPSWNFHPAYIYGNERVSCMICILGSCGDIKNGATHNPELFNTMVEMEAQSGFTFKQNQSLKDIF